MKLLFIVLGISVIIFILLLLFIFLVCGYFFKFTILRKSPATLEKNIDANTDWHVHLDFIRERKAWFQAQPLEECSITSFDKLKLYGNILYSKEPSDKFVICCHGYTSDGLTNYGAYAKFYYENNVNMLIIDARAHGKSEGKYIGFGVLDRYDVKKWIEFLIDKFGNDISVYLHGVSMGGATVLMTSGLETVSNVKGIVADCAYTSADDVFSHILKRNYHLPRFPIMNITSAISMRRAGYGFSDASTLDAVSKTDIPILFIHGKKDDFVPEYMTEQNFDACKSEKRKLIVEDADHAEAYYCAREEYEREISRLMKLDKLSGSLK